MINVYAIKTSNEQLYQKIIKNINQILTAKEIQIAENYKKIGDKKNYIIGKYLTKKKISEYLGIKIKEVEIKTDAYKRPFLNKLGWPNFDFNLSHSGDWAILAISHKGKVGVDIEKISHFNKDIIFNYFSTDEQAYILHDRRYPENFYKLWTLKESYIKAKGKGLYMDLKSFEFVTNGRCGANLKKKIGQHWYFKTGKIDRQYRFSICSEEASISPRVKLVKT